MNKMIKAKWVKALRSGKYRQGQNALRDDKGRYCCLGVLRTVMDKGSRLSDGYGEHLHESHEKMAGLTWKKQHRLADMNDDGYTLEEIADYIEKHL